MEEEILLILTLKKKKVKLMQSHGEL